MDLTKKNNQIGVFKRASLYILRKRAKSIVLLVILMVLVTLVLTGLSIGNATEAAAAELRETLGGYFKLETNGEADVPDVVSDALIAQLMEIDGIKSHNGMNTAFAMTPELVLSPGRFTSENDPKARLARFIGNTDSGLHEYFVTRTFALAQGRHIGPNDAKKAIISKGLAELNGLRVGDTFEVAITQDMPDAVSGGFGKSYAFEIVGIYEINTRQITDATTAECDIADNFIFVDGNSGKEILSDTRGISFENYRSGAAFFVRDPQEMGAVLERVKTMDGPVSDGFNVIVNTKAYDTSAGPLHRLDGYVNLLVIMIIAIGVILLSLVLTMWMRDRLHEIGVYMSIGIKKTSIIGQHILEALIVLVVAMLLAWPASGFIAKTAGNAIFHSIPIEEQAPESDTLPDAVQQRINPLNIAEASQTKELDISIGAVELLTVAGYAVLIVFISVGASSILVLRMKPKDILSSAS